MVGTNTGVMSLLLPHLRMTLAILLVCCSPSYVSSVRYRKLCKDTDIQIMTRRGVKIEPYERSRVELTLAGPLNKKYKNKLVLSFEFRTLSANGTLFYGRSNKNPQEMIALVLRDGHLVYKIQCPSLYADVRLSTRESRPLNDNKWHTVDYMARLGRHGQKGHIKIDGHGHTKRYDVNCEKITSVVMGGQDPDDSQHRNSPHMADNHGHYEGCIRRLGVKSFLSTPPKYYAVSQCE